MIVSLVFQFIYHLRQKVKMEEQLTEHKLKFFTNVSHELRTPLTLISGPLEELSRRTDLPQDVSRQIEMISNNAANMERLVNQILDFSKLAKGKMRLVVEHFDAVFFLQRELENYALLSESSHIPLKFDCKLDKLPLWADVEKLRQILNNLLSNAFKYSNQGNPIIVSLTTEEGMAVFSVRDNGVGINQDRMNNLFERFNGTLRRTPSGQSSSGIGLSVTRELILLHKGDISVKSKPGEGSCVIFRLPLGIDHFPSDTEFIASDETSPVTEASSAPVPATVSDDDVTVLVAEDNDELRHFISHTLSADYHVLEASNGEEALQLAHQHIPDLIISDLMMPQLDGFQLAMQLHQQQQLSHIPLVMLSALADSDTRMRCLELGVDDFITKPFNVTYLKARVNNLLRKRSFLQSYYKNLFSFSAMTDSDEFALQVPAIKPSSETAFISLVMDHMQENINNADYSVDDMAEAIHMSRSAFSRKLRALMGQSPTDILRDMRMRRAALLIDGGELSITQVAYETGFNDPHYFGKCFKAFYQMTPSDWKGRTR